jgi:hypothetical protein
LWLLFYESRGFCTAECSVTEWECDLNIWVVWALARVREPQAQPHLAHQVDLTPALTNQAPVLVSVWCMRTAAKYAYSNAGQALL